MSDWYESLSDDQRKRHNNNKYALRKKLNVPDGYVLHHKDPSWKTDDIERYIEWNEDDVVVMSKSEHIKWHNLNTKNYETYHQPRPEQSERMRGEGNPMYGVHRYGRQGTTNGKHWYTNGITEGFYFEGEQPNGFVKGRAISTAGKCTTCHKAKGEESGAYGKHWYTNGEEDILCFEGDQPNGWVRGRKSKNIGKNQYSRKDGE